MNVNLYSQDKFSNFRPGMNLKSEKKSSGDEISSHLKHVNTLRTLAKDRDELIPARNSPQN